MNPRLALVATVFAALISSATPWQDADAASGLHVDQPAEKAQIFIRGQFHSAERRMAGDRGYVRGGPLHRGGLPSGYSSIHSKVWCGGSSPQPITGGERESLLAGCK